VHESARTEPQELRRRLVERFPFFAGMPAARLDALVADAQFLRAPAGAVLFDANQPCRGFPLVLEGSVRVTKNAPNGREILLYRVEPGQSCIQSGGCLLGHADYSASGVAETEVELLSVPPAQFNELLLGFEPFRRYVFGMYGERLAEVTEYAARIPAATAQAIGRQTMTWDEIRALDPRGFDERFRRMWRYYLAYCAAGFSTRRTDVLQAHFRHI